MKKIYWAKEEPEKLVESLEEKWRTCQGHLKSSIYWNRVLRNVAYFHGHFFNSSSDSLDMELKLIGNESEYIGFGANHFRNLLEHIFQLAARDRVAMKARAVNSDNKSLHQARMGTSIVDYYQREKGLEDYLRTAALHALIFAQGFTHHPWDPEGGEQLVSEEPVEEPQMPLYDENGEPLPPPPPNREYEGDFTLSNPTICDLAWDFARPWAQAQWVIVREPKNKWDLIARHPHLEDDILNASLKEDQQHSDVSIYRGSVDVINDDLVNVYRFYHKKTEAIPTGRYTYYVAGKDLTDTEFPYRGFPLSRISPGEWIGQGTGWTPAFSLQAPQEMLTGELSAVASNHAAFATQDMWVPAGQERLKVTRLKGGLRILSGGVKPEPLSLLSTPPEVFKFIQDLINHMQLVAGITGATRGVPEAGVTAGNALALLDAKSIQFASSFVYAFERHNEDVCTFMLRALRDFSRSERTITILGKANRPYQDKFVGDDLDLIDRVVVESVNPLSKTLAGKDAKAKDLIQIGAIRSVEQYNQVYETGNIDPMFEAEQAQLSIIRDENEALLDGEPVDAVDTDNHVLHVKEHNTLFGTINNRRDPNIVKNGVAHIMNHIQRMIQPGVQLFQQTLGYPVPPGFPAMAAAMAQGGTTVTSNTNQVAEPEPLPDGGAPEIRLPKPAKPPKQAQVEV